MHRETIHSLSKEGKQRLTAAARNYDIPASSPFGEPFGSPSGGSSGSDGGQFGASGPGRCDFPQGIDASARVQSAITHVNTGGNSNGHTCDASSSPSRCPFGGPFGSGSGSCQFGIQALEGGSSSPDLDASARHADSSLRSVLEPPVPSILYSEGDGHYLYATAGFNKFPATSRVMVVLSKGQMSSSQHR